MAHNRDESLPPYPVAPSNPGAVLTGPVRF